MIYEDTIMENAWREHFRVKFVEKFRDYLPLDSLLFSPNLNLLAAEGVIQYNDKERQEEKCPSSVSSARAKYSSPAWEIAYCPGIDIQDIEPYLSEPLFIMNADLVYVARNPQISYEILLKYLDYPEGWIGFSANPNLRWSHIQANPDKGWQWGFISENPGITLENIQNNPDAPWEAGWLAENPNLSWEFILDNPIFRQDDIVGKISCHPSISWDIIRDNPEFPWNWYGVSANPNIKWETVLENPTRPWNYSALSGNPNISMDIIRANPDKMWNMDRFSGNPNVTWELLEQLVEGLKHLESSSDPDPELELKRLCKALPWNWNALASNTFLLERERFYTQLRQQTVS